MTLRTISAFAAALLAALAGLRGTALAEEGSVKLLHVLVEDDRLVASNIQFNRFDELRLQAKEQVLEKAEADAVAVIVTNQRIIAYSVFTAAWRPLRTRAGETVSSIDAQDYGAIVLTSERILNFNGRNGVWAATRR